MGLNAIKFNRISMILVTGGAGYIGAHANKELNLSGYETVVLDNMSYGHEDFLKWGVYENIDLGDLESLRMFSGNMISMR